MNLIFYASCEKFIHISYDSDSEKLMRQQAYCDSKARSLLHEIY